MHGISSPETIRPRIPISWSASPTVEQTPDTAGSILVAQAIAGDKAALRALWETHRRYAAAVILAHKPASADLDDLLQDVATTVVAKISTLDSPAAFLGWLRMVSLNVARLAGRKHAAARIVAILDGHSAPPEPATSDDSATPAGSALQTDSAFSLLSYAAQIPDEYREPLLLKSLRNLSYRQIAAAMDLSETTVETRIARARRMVRELATRADRFSAQPTLSGGQSSTIGSGNSLNSALARSEA